MDGDSPAFVEGWCEAYSEATLISLQVAREYGAGLVMSVNFSTQVSRQQASTHRKLFFNIYGMCHGTEKMRYIIF